MCSWLATVMRQKAFLLFLTCVILTSLFMILMPTRRQRSFKNLVKETQDKIINLRENIISAGESLDTDQSSVQPDDKYLKILGLSNGDPRDPSEIGGLSYELVVLTAVDSSTVSLAPGFIRSVARHQPDASIIIQDLGLSRRDKATLNRLCNSSLCMVSEFQYSLWPNHVRDLKLQAYRPLIIQLALRENSLVLWMDVDCRFSDGDLSVWISKVKKSGVVAWVADPLTKDGGDSKLGGGFPTTALTHPRMFEYFPQVKKEDYEFQHMVSGRCLMFYSFPNEPSSSPSHEVELSSTLILPWLKCVLIEDCINPIGAQSTGCRFDKKPQYRYSGCHSYDVSALNIVLGDTFRFMESRYISNQTFIKRLTQDRVPSAATAVLNISEYGLV